MKVTSIWLFVPNIIGYIRIFLAFLAFYVAFDAPLLFIVAYGTSFVLDTVDGMAARAFNQSTQFGAILDMFTDRGSTSAMIVVVSHVMPNITHLGIFIAASLVFLDISSHFVRMYASLILKRGNHKDTSSCIFSLLDVYYSNRKVMGALCFGQEATYL
eukprot:Tbor_TRINITY_DN5359_c0_g1::TRINITY_DN5359_c0_g1_i1::g.4817::m.4817/K00999/CDIPT; CDP-diacylglycerol--inositol 3-phosphatidyltransferase